MPAYRYACDRCHERMALAILTEVRPAVFVCDPCIRHDDAARDQWAAQTNTSPLDEATQRILGLWHIRQRRQQHGGASW